MKKMIFVCFIVGMQAQEREELAILYEQLQAVHNTMNVVPTRSFDQWKKEILRGTHITNVMSEAQFIKLIQECTQSLAQQIAKGSWIIPQNFQQQYEQFIRHTLKLPALYAKKLLIPADTKCAIWGDIHGSIFSLLRMLNELKQQDYLNDDFTLTQKDNIHLIFLGDHTDRGNNSCEVLYTLLKLYMANPERVILIRGNHENIDLNARYGVLKELLQKFGKYEEIFTALKPLYDMLPAACFLSCPNSVQQDYLLLCHGGPIVDQHTKPLNTLQNLSNTALAACKELIISNAQYAFLPWSDPEYDPSFGFIWNDFVVDKNVTQLRYNQGRGYAITENYLVSDEIPLRLYYSSVSKKIFLQHIIRGHQHNNSSGNMLELLKERGGMVQLWDPEHPWVTTLLSAPESHLGFNYDSYLMLTMQPVFKDITFEHRSKK